ncbi:MAG: colanic acid biosynthesis glycosyltransferase WcaL [Desulfobacteraceae bacterium]|nr:MAG: colanic acid biosynthesis glycosyltransferase WcaL [Desulfobacteraceae bacterium]
MRIGFIVDQFPVVTETFILNQITGLIDRGHQVYIYSKFFSKTTEVHAEVIRYNLLENNRKLQSVPSNYMVRFLGAWFLIFRHLRKMKIKAIINSLNFLKYGRQAVSLRLLYDTIYFLRDNIDIVHCQFGTLGHLGLLYREIGAVPEKIVVSFRGHDATKYLHNNPGAYRKLFRVAHLFLPVSNELKKNIVMEGCDEKKIIVHHSGIDLKKFQYIDPVYPANKVIRVITIARLIEMKGVEYAIRAIGKVAEKGGKIEYTIIGDGILRPNLEDLIKNLGLGQSVQIIGWKKHDEVVKMVCNSHILIAPSVTAADGDKEGIPNVVKEAMALGTLVISTWHGGIPELVEDKVSGFLVPERDVEAIAERIEHLVDHPDIWNDLSRNARKLIESEFEIESLNNSLVKIYEQMR